MKNILLPVSIFIVCSSLSLLAAQLAVVFFFVGAFLNIFVNRRKKGNPAGAGDETRDILLIRSSYALMAPSFIFVAIILFGMLGAIFQSN